jgi:crotonobetainyl-CoA:carnitine CoA-transferase CaiB-like acyl-CoA transferase
LSDSLDRFPLEALRVLDLSTGISGPYATKLLADAGAAVVKIESREGDPLRGWKSSARMGISEALAPAEDGALFRFLNTSKRSAVLDIESKRGRAQFLELAATADLVVESFAPGRMQELGLGIDQLRAVKPTVCLVSITPWGQDGPWAKRAATDFTVQAEMGSMYEGGYEDRPPVAVGGFLGEYFCGTFAAVGALSAYRKARSNGRGEHVDVSLAECTLVGHNKFRYLQRQLEPGFVTPRYVEIPAIEPAKDGLVGFCAFTGQHWTDFTIMMERPDLLEDPDLMNGLIRGQTEWLREAVQQWTRQHTVEELIEKSTLFRIPVAPIGNGKTVLSMDHFVERGVFVENPAGFRQPRIPYRLGKGRNRAFTAAPALGQHTREILEQARSQTGGAKSGSAPTAHDTGAVDLPLAGIRVVDLTAFLAGPFASWCLAALGADVIKVESVQRPDGMRFVLAGANIPSQGPLWECSPIFHGGNSGKRAITLNLDSEAGLSLLKRLIKDADIVIENFSPRVLGHFGLSWEAIHELNPDAILVRMPAFGLDGPWRERPGFAMSIEHVSGVAWVTGYPDRPPLAPRCCDPLGGILTVFATLLALEVRSAGGGGQLVEVPLVEAGLSAAAEQVLEWTAYGVLLERTANRGPRAVPQGVYLCSGDEFIAVAVETNAQWKALVAALGSPAWAMDDAFSREAGRREAHDLIDRNLASWCAQRRVEEAVEQLAAAGVPVGVARNSALMHPHLQLDARGFFVRRHHPAAGVLDYPSFPVRFSGQFLPIRSPAPVLGQHNEEVLRDILGLSPKEIAELRASNVIGDHPLFI